MASEETQLEEVPVEKRSVKALQLQQLKRSFDLFAGNYGSKPDVDTGRSVEFGSHVVTQRCCVRCMYIYGSCCLLQSRSQAEMQGRCCWPTAC